MDYHKLSVWMAFVKRHKHWFNKYVVTLVLFVIIVGFVDKNNFMRQLQYASEERNLRDEIEKYKKEYMDNTLRLNELESDSGAIEQVAREKYLMKRMNEDIYVFEEDLK